MINGLKYNEKYFFIITLSLQIAIVFLLFMDIIGFSMNILREILSIPYLLLIPGALIYRLLIINDKSPTERLLYSLGLSLIFIFSITFIMNFIYPIFGVKNPLSFNSVFITINAIVIILLFLAAIKTKTFDKPKVFETECFKLPAFYFLLTLPFISILGTYIMNIYNINFILMSLILLISIIPLLVTWDKLIPKNLFPLAVFMIALSLLFHRSLISYYLWGWDVQHEYYLSHLVIINGFWDYTFPSESNSMLPIVLLAPSLSLFSGINLTWIYKIVFPFIFAFVPVGLYKIFEKQTNSKIAFLACFFFISFFGFFQQMPQLGRQEIAEFFLVLILLLFINDSLDKMKKAILILIFSVGLIVSHYGLSYIYIGLITCAWFLNFIIQKKYSWFNNKFNRDFNISLTIVLFLFVTSIFWYMNTSFSSSFDIIVKLISHISESLYEFMNPQSAQGIAIITSSTVTIVGRFSKYMQIITQSFIMIGVVYTVFYYLKNNFNYIKIELNTDYFYLVIMSLVLCILAIGTPYLASALNTSRLYQINLIFLSVFCIIGGLVTLKFLSRSSLSLNKNLKIMSIFLVIYLLINTGFVNQISNEPTSLSLTKSIDYPTFNQKEVAGANWLFQYSINSNTYSDMYRRLLLMSYYGKDTDDLGSIHNFPRFSYLYFGTLNINSGKFATHSKEGVSSSLMYNDLNKLDKLFNASHKIYDNSGSEILFNENNINL